MDNATSGLFVTDGSAINLQLVNGVVVGVVSGGTFNGQAAFAISIDSGTGVVTVEQYLSLHQDSATDTPDDAVSMLAGRLGITVTATDADNDQATGHVDVSAQISFADDGPSVTAVGSGVTLALDEGNTDSGAPPTSTPATINTGAIAKGDDPDVAGHGLHFAGGQRRRAGDADDRVWRGRSVWRIAGNGNELCAVGDQCGVGAFGDRRCGDQPCRAGERRRQRDCRRGSGWQPVYRPGGVCDLDRPRTGRGDG